MAAYSLAELERSGIYKIVNTVSGKCYIGSAVMLRRRWAGHLSLLRKGMHHSKHLQNSWSKRGELAFTFEIIEFCDVGSLIQREQFWIDRRKPEYNCHPTAGSPLGFKHGPEFRDQVSIRFKGKRKSSEHLDLMRQASIERWKDSDFREKNSLAIKNAYTPELLEIRAKGMKDRWQDPEYKSLMKSKIAKSHDQERRSLTSQQSKLRWADPEFRAMMVKKRNERSLPKN